MRLFLKSVAGVALAVGLVVPAFAANVNGQSPSDAIPLANTASTSLVGSGAGAFRYFTFTPPGDGNQESLSISFGPTDPVTANAVGVNLWQNGVLLATMNGVGTTPGSNLVTFAPTSPSPVLVQVYNYDQDETVSAQLILSGVNPPAPAAVAPAPTAAPANPVATTPRLTQAMVGTLPGNGAGDFTYYTIDYAGDGSTRTLMLAISPVGLDVTNAVEISVFQNGTLLASATGQAATSPGQIPVSFSSMTAGPILVQIGNYNPGVTVSYTLTP